MSDIKDIKDLRARLNAILDAQDKGKKPPLWSTKTRRERIEEEEKKKKKSPEGGKKISNKEGTLKKKKKEKEETKIRGYRGNKNTKKMLDDLEKEGH